MKYLHALFFILTLVATNQALGNEISYQIDKKPFQGYFINQSKEAPLIFLVHDWDGLTEYEIKRAHMLAEKGYSVFAVDLFGKGIRPTTTKEKRKLTGKLYKNRTQMRLLLESAIHTAQSKGAKVENAIAMGYCFGGTAVLELARSGVDLKGFVTFYGGLSIPESQDYSKTKGKILVFHGSADKNVTMDHFSKLAVELESKEISHEMITYSSSFEFNKNALTT